MIHSRPARLAVLFCSIAAAACKSSGGTPPIEGVRSADDARAGLLATLTVAPLDRISGDVDGLSRALGLPFQGKDLLTMLAAQHRMDASTTAQIDTAQPIGMAFVAPAAKGKEPLGAVVLSARGKDGAAKLLAALGTAGEKQKGAQKVTRADGSVLWVATHEASVFASASYDGLVAAAMLALEAQRPPASDVVVNIFPDALARWQGTDVRTALAGFRKEMLDQQISVSQRRGGPVPGAAERLIYETTIDLFLDPLAETVSGALTIDLDAARGIRLGLRLDPRKGSAFAKRIGVPTPYAVDPALYGASGDTIAGVWALGPSPFWLEVYDGIFKAQAKAGMRGAAEVSKHYQTLRPYFTGAGSGAIRLRQGALASDAVIPLKGGAPAAALDAMSALASSRGFTELLGEIYGRATPRVQARRERDTLRTELAFPLRDRPGDPGTALKAFFGSPTLAMLTTVTGGRLLMATEPAASNRLAALVAGKPAAPGPDLQTALDETRGQDGFFYLDLWSLVKPTIAATAGPRQAQMIGMVINMPGFSQLKLPMVMSYKGGQALDAELRVPLSTLSNAANVARPFLGMARP